LITPFDKAIVALVVPLVVFMLAHVGFNVDAEFSAALTTLVTGIAVYLTPNK
jgi:hypothetical protein